MAFWRNCEQDVLVSGTALLWEPTELLWGKEKTIPVSFIYVLFLAAQWLIKKPAQRNPQHRHQKIRARTHTNHPAPQLNKWTVGLLLI